LRLSDHDLIINTLGGKRRWDNATAVTVVRAQSPMEVDIMAAVACSPDKCNKAIIARASFPKAEND
jgi:hypothetical protein